MGLFKSKPEKVLDLFEKSYFANFDQFVRFNADTNRGPREFNMFHGASLRNAAHEVRQRYSVGVDTNYFDDTYRQMMLMKFPWGRQVTGESVAEKKAKAQGASCDTYVKQGDGNCATCGVHWFDHNK